MPLKSKMEFMWQAEMDGNRLEVQLYMEQTGVREREAGMATDISSDDYTSKLLWSMTQACLLQAISALSLCLLELHEGQV